MGGAGSGVNTICFFHIFILDFSFSFNTSGRGHFCSPEATAGSEEEVLAGQASSMLWLHFQAFKSGWSCELLQDHELVMNQSISEHGHKPFF